MRGQHSRIMLRDILAEQRRMAGQIATESVRQARSLPLRESARRPNPRRSRRVIESAMTAHPTTRMIACRKRFGRHGSRAPRTGLDAKPPVIRRFAYSRKRHVLFSKSERHGHRPGAEKPSGNAERRAWETRWDEERLTTRLDFYFGFNAELSLNKCLTDQSV
jgi:hypothetical protein